MSSHVPHLSHRRGLRALQALQLGDWLSTGQANKGYSSHSKTLEPLKSITEKKSRRHTKSTGTKNGRLTKGKNESRGSQRGSEAVPCLLSIAQSPAPRAISHGCGARALPCHLSHYPKGNWGTKQWASERVSDGTHEREGPRAQASRASHNPHTLRNPSVSGFPPQTKILGPPLVM